MENIGRVEILSLPIIQRKVSGNCLNLKSDCLLANYATDCVKIFLVESFSSFLIRDLRKLVKFSDVVKIYFLIRLFCEEKFFDPLMFESKAEINNFAKKWIHN